MLFLLLVFSVFHFFIFTTNGVAVPDVVKNFQSSVQTQNMQTILTSIEQRLRNLDNIYSMHLSSTLNDKLDQYQHKFQTIDTKITRFESLMQLNLDKISENISTKNFKDDLFRTSLIKKIDSIYEGINHRLNYMDRKFESSINKMQNTLDRLEKSDKSIGKQNEEFSNKLLKTIATLEELKMSYLNVESNIVNNTNENFEIALNEQTNLIKSYNDKTNKIIINLINSTTKRIQASEGRIMDEVRAINETSEYLKTMKNELKHELNEYAIKVAEMNSENWKTGKSITEKNDILEVLINSTKNELQTGIRSVLIQLGKTTTENESKILDLTNFEKLNEKLDANFEKVFAAQNTFKNSCYRLQMDEPQIELKISEILEKIIETFEQKTTIKLKDIQNLENLIKSHDSHNKKRIIQVNTHLDNLLKTTKTNHKNFETEFQQTIAQLNTFLHPSKYPQFAERQELFEDIKEIKTNIFTLAEQRTNLTNLLSNIKNLIENLYKTQSNLARKSNDRIDTNWVLSHPINNENLSLAQANELEMIERNKTNNGIVFETQTDLSMASNQNNIKLYSELESHEDDDTSFEDEKTDFDENEYNNNDNQE